MQSLGLDGRVDRLGEQRPGQAAAAQRAPRELDAGGEPFEHRPVARGGLRHGVDLALRGAAEDLGEQVGLGRKVAVHGAGGDAGAPGDGGDRRGL